MDYKNGRIYRLVSPSALQYVGSTTQPLYKRKSVHKSKWKSGTNLTKSTMLFEDAKANGGDVEIFLLEEFPCQNKEQLYARERHWIETIEGGCVNKVIPGRTSKEYREANREAHNQRQKAYREANREAISQRQKAYFEAYREANREAISQQKKAYYEANREAISQRQKAYFEAYYEANREAIKKRQKAYREAKMKK